MGGERLTTKHTDMQGKVIVAISVPPKVMELNQPSFTKPETLSYACRRPTEVDLSDTETYMDAHLYTIIG